MIYFLTKNVEKYDFKEVVVTDDEEMCYRILDSLPSMGYDKEATSLNTLLARELLDSWGNQHVQVVVDKTTCNPAFQQKLADKYELSGFNIKYDLTLARSNGLYIRRVKDAMLTEQRLGLGSGRPNNLLATYERRTLKNFPTLKQTRTEFINWPKDRFFEEYHVIYSAYDVQVMPEILEVQKDLVANANLDFLLDIENRLIPILGKMEVNGFTMNEIAWRKLVDENVAKKAQSELKLDAILEQMKPLYPVLNDYTFKRIFATQTNLLYEPKDAGIKTFNYSSSPALLKLFKAAGLPIPMKNVKDFKLKKKVLKPSTADTALQEYLIKYPNTPFRVLIDELIIYKKLEKLLNSFGMRFLVTELRTKSAMKLGYKNPKTNKVHTTYRQIMTATGRLASGDEKNGFYNSQQLPKKNAYRNCFTLSDDEIKAGWKICTLDLSGAEVIIAASLSGEMKVVKMKDIHSELATPAYRNVIKHIKNTYDEKLWITQVKILLSNTKFNCSDEEANIAIQDTETYTINKTDSFRAEIRDDFKRVVYGLFYGGTSARIAEVLNIPLAWGEIVEKTLKEELPILFKYLEDNAHKAKSEGFVIFNKRTNSRHIFKSYLEAAKFNRKLTKLESSQIERNAKNYPIQGTQADMIKEGMVNVEDWVVANCEDRFQWLLQVHDEIVFKFLGDNIVPQVEKIITDTCDKYLIEGINMSAAYHINTYWEK